MRRKACCVAVLLCCGGRRGAAQRGAARLVGRPLEALPAFTHYVPGRHGAVAAYDLNLLVGLELEAVALRARGGALLRARHRLGQLLGIVHRDLVRVRARARAKV